MLGVERGFVGGVKRERKRARKRANQCASPVVAARTLRCVKGALPYQPVRVPFRQRDQRCVVAVVRAYPSVMFRLAAPGTPRVYNRVQKSDGNVVAKFDAVQ